MTTLTVLHNEAFASKDPSVELFCDPAEWLGLPDTTVGSLRIWKVGETQWRIVVDDPVNK